MAAAAPLTHKFAVEVAQFTSNANAHPLGPPKGAFCETRHGQTHYHLLGGELRGEVLVLAHDTESSLADMEGLAAALHERRGVTVLSYDYYDRGHSTYGSESGAKNRTGDGEGQAARFDLDLYLTQARMLLQRLALLGRPIVWVGHGLGGFLGMRYAARHPTHVQALVMMSSASSTRRPLLEEGEEYDGSHGGCFGDCLMGAARALGRAFCGGIGTLERELLLRSVRAGHCDVAHFHCLRAQNAAREMARGGSRGDTELAARYMHAVKSTRACLNQAVMDQEAVLVIANRIAPHHRPVLLIWPRNDPEQLLPRELRRLMTRSRLFAPQGASRSPVAEASSETADAIVSFTTEAAAAVAARESRPAVVKQTGHIITGEKTQASREVAAGAAKASVGEFSEKSKFAQSMLTTEVMLSGWLEKKSKLGQWQPRFCEVSSHYLRYYIEEPKASAGPSNGADMRAAIDLLQVSKIEADLSAGRSFVIRFRDGTKTEMRVPLTNPGDKKKGGKKGAGTPAEDEKPPEQVVSQWVELLSGGGGSAQFE